MTDSGDSRNVPEDPIPPAVRDRAVAALTRGFASDQLSDVELETLLDRVYGATTLTELNALISNLPVLRSAVDIGSVEAAESATPPAVTPPQRISALLSGQERQLTGLVPRSLQLVARLGHVELDLSGATFEPGVTNIDVRALLGYVKLRLPADVGVESDGDALLGFFALEGAGSSEASRSERVVRITGRAILGFAECHVRASGPGARGELGRMSETALPRRSFLALVSAVGMTPLALPWAIATNRQSGARMYGLIGKITAVAGQRDALAGILLEGTQDMPGCLSYIVASDQRDPDALWVTEVWDSKASHEASLSLPAVQAAIAKGRPLIAGFGDRVETAPIGGVGLSRTDAG